MKRALGIMLACLSALACARPAPNLVARLGSLELTLADLDLYVRSLPASRRLAPQEDRKTWVTELVLDLAVERALTAHPEVLDRTSGPEAEARVRVAVLGRVARLAAQSLGRAANPDREALAARVVEASPPKGEAYYNFRHVFLRLDRVSTPGEADTIRERAEEIARRARRGEDFGSLARQFSESVSADEGGLLENQRPSRLEAVAREALSRLAEGEVSEVIETRTGLHVFRMERILIPAKSPVVSSEPARTELIREAASESRTALLGELRHQIEVTTATFPWWIGDTQLSRAELELILPAASRSESAQQMLVDWLLLAEAGRRQGLWTPELEASVRESQAAEARREIYRRSVSEYVEALPVETVRLAYDASPSAFSAPELAHLDLIFVAEGRDAFATQRRLEGWVSELRGGASFAELAREVSTGPGAETGGDLGELPPSEWARLGPKIYEAVTGLEVGVISDPVHVTGRILTTEPRTLRGGFAILRVRAKTPPRPRAVEEVIEEVRTVYARQYADEIDRAVRDEILAEAGFELVRLPALDELTP